MVDWYYGEISTLVTLHSYGGTNQQSTEKQICTKLHVQVEQAKCCFNMFSQNQNKAERLNPSEKDFVTPFYGWGSTVSKLQRHYEETVYFLPLLVLNWSTSEGWKAQLTLEPSCSFEPGTPYWVVPRWTLPFILPRSISWVPWTPGKWMVKSKLSASFSIVYCSFLNDVWPISLFSRAWIISYRTQVVLTKVLSL